MNSRALALSLLLLPLAAGAKPPVKRSSVPGPYPSIIQLDPDGGPTTAPADGVYDTELGGREVHFLQEAQRAAAELRALAEAAKGKETGEQIKSISDMLSSLGETERGQLEELGKARKLGTSAAAADGLKKQLGALAGARFEKAWVERFIAAANLSFEAYAIGAGSADAEIKSFAEKMRPVAQARLQMANRLGGRSMQAPTPVPPGAQPPPTGPATPVVPAGGPAPIPPPVVPGGK